MKRFIAISFFFFSFRFGSGAWWWNKTEGGGTATSRGGSHCENGDVAIVYDVYGFYTAELTTNTMSGWRRMERASVRVSEKEWGKF